MCEEACPVDAIELTSLYDLSGKSREEMIFDKEKLLSVYDQTKDAEPMRRDCKLKIANCKFDNLSILCNLQFRTFAVFRSLDSMTHDRSPTTS